MMAEMRMDDVAMRDRENERKIVTSLYANQTHLNFINNNKEVHLQSKKEKALKRAQYVDEQNERQREEEEKLKEKKTVDMVNKMRQLEVKRNEAQENLRATFYNPQKVSHA